MDEDDMMPIAADLQRMWTLSADRKTVNLNLPPLRLGGVRKPITVHLDFDAGIVDSLLDRLTILRTQMLPPLPVPNKRN